MTSVVGNIKNEDLDAELVETDRCAASAWAPSPSGEKNPEVEFSRLADLPPAPIVGATKLGSEAKSYKKWLTLTRHNGGSVRVRADDIMGYYEDPFNMVGDEIVTTLHLGAVVTLFVKETAEQMDELLGVEQEADRWRERAK